MLHRPLLLLTWILVASMQTLRCQGETCQAVPQATVAPHRLSIFPSRDICEDYRRHLEQQTPPVVRSQTRPDVTIRKQITYTCQLGGIIP
jgi:hypothetical protein